MTTAEISTPTQKYKREWSQVYAAVLLAQTIHYMAGYLFLGKKIT